MLNGRIMNLFPAAVVGAVIWMNPTLLDRAPFAIGFVATIAGWYLVDALRPDPAREG